MAQNLSSDGVKLMVYDANHQAVTPLIDGSRIVGAVRCQLRLCYCHYLIA
jgi:hypothetical protein